MSYHFQHTRMKPVLDLARQMDIASNSHPDAIFEAGNGGFQVWCTPENHPEGWGGVRMTAGAFSKPCEYVGSVLWKWENDRIVGLQIETTAYALQDQQSDEFIDSRETCHSYHNRPADIEWLKEKVRWLFETAGVPLLPFEYESIVTEARCQSKGGTPEDAWLESAFEDRISGEIDS